MRVGVGQPVLLDVALVAPVLAPAVSEEPVVSSGGVRAVTDELDG